MVTEINVSDGHYERCRFLIQNAERNGEKILDVGCADGFMFRDKNLDVVEVDLIYAFGPEYKGRVKFFKSDAHHLPFRDRTFKCVILGDMLEHVKDPIQVLKEAKRVGGSIYITVPDEWEWDEPQRPFQANYHVRFYDLEMLKDHLRKGLGEGFKIIKIKGGGWSFFCVSYER